MRPKPTTFIVAACLVASLVGVVLTGCSSEGPGLPFGGHGVGRTFTAADWDTLAANPDAYKGASVSFVGKVVSSFDARQSPPSLVVFTDPTAPTGVAVLIVAADPGVKAGELVIVKGKVLGEFKGSGPFSGTDVTTVLVQASSVDVTSTPPTPGGD